MYTNFNNMLNDAYRDHRAIASFNWYNYETLKGIIDSAEAAGTPVIASFGAKYLSNMDLDTAATLTLNLADKSSQPVCLHLDHCSDKNVIIQAIHAGFGSVMYDGSKLPYEDNVRCTREVCEIAHACGISVEAELGSLAAGLESHEGNADDREVYTDPSMAHDFIKETGVDALAVSIGTVHGMYKGTPNIRTDILSDINKACGIPLVLHGGSGTPEEKLIECIRNGICKINVNTEISSYVVEHTHKLLETSAPHLSVLALHQIDWVREITGKYLKLFNGCGN